MSEGFKGGTRKGLDVTIGDEARAVRGGILIRAMREVDGARKVVEGPSLVCDRILEELGARTVKELVEETWEGKVEVWNREGGLWIEKVDGEEGCGCECAEEGGDAAAEKDEDKSSSAAQAANEAVDEAADNTATKASASTSTSTRKRSRSDITTTTTTTDPASFFIVKRLKPTGIPTTRRNPHPPLHTSSRVGLTLTNVTPTTRSRLEFVHKPYRYMQHPHLLRKGRQLLVLAMLSAGFPVRRVADVTGAGETAMEGWKRDMEEGKKKGRQVLKEFVGKKAAGEAKWAAKIFGAVRWWEMEMMERGVEEKF
ncbi:hypothetical protein BC936DRAFT_142487 [Jimgerdemannia flammicorona]|uniref:Uncharacterized protein n=1 Tax=Jimgerdemannia flammicorona TaxID=994334 RepID=A0A433DF52_9FUNG|nr:hypothetical protein BC936DRAFT_142487 [Jimgerdemannia flammicorona]